MSGLVNPVAVETIQMGGRTFFNSSKYFLLYGYAGPSGKYTTLRKANGTAGYPVTAGKTLTVLAIRFYVGAAGAAAELMYGDTDVGASSAAAPTNAVGLAENAALGNFDQIMGQSAVVGYQEQPCDFTVPATKFPAMRNNNTAAGLYAIFICSEA